MTEESRTDFSSNQSRKPFFSPAYATKQGTINRNFPSVSFPNSFPRSARALVLLKKPIIQPSIQTFQQNLTVHDSPKSDRHDKRNPPIHPRQSARSGERSDPSIDRVGSRRVVARGRRRARIASPPYVIPRLTIRIAPHIHAEASRTERVRCRCRSSPDPPSTRAVPTPTPRIRHRSSHARATKRTLPAGFLAETFLVPPRGVFAAATMTRVVLTASISFSRVRPSYSDARFGSVRLPRRARVRPASDVRDIYYWEIQWVLFCTYVAF